MEDRQLLFTMTATVQNTKQVVTIGRDTWKSLMPRLKQYEIIEIAVRPIVVIDTAEAMPPPEYQSPGDIKIDLYVSRTPSPILLDVSSSSRPPSRPSSPGLRKALSWFGGRASGGSQDGKD